MKTTNTTVHGSSFKLIDYDDALYGFSEDKKGVYPTHHCVLLEYYKFKGGEKDKLDFFDSLPNTTDMPLFVYASLCCDMLKGEDIIYPVSPKDVCQLILRQAKNPIFYKEKYLRRDAIIYVTEKIRDIFIAIHSKKISLAEAEQFVT